MRILASIPGIIALLVIAAILSIGILLKDIEKNAKERNCPEIRAALKLC